MGYLSVGLELYIGSAINQQRPRNQAVKDAFKGLRIK